MTRWAERGGGVERGGGGIFPLGLNPLMPGLFAPMVAHPPAAQVTHGRPLGVDRCFAPHWLLVDEATRTLGLLDARVRWGAAPRCSWGVPLPLRPAGRSPLFVSAGYGCQPAVGSSRRRHGGPAALGMWARPLMGGEGACRRLYVTRSAPPPRRVFHRSVRSRGAAVPPASSSSTAR